MYHKFFLFGMALILGACTVAPTPNPTVTPFPEEFSTQVKIGEYNMKIKCEGKGEPTIILENEVAFLSWMTPKYSKISRTCTYPRVGMAGEPARGPRTSLDQVNELHELLKRSGVPGPYILVGHDVGGLNLLIYTDQYPQEVVGLVCVDCIPVTFGESLVEKIKGDFANEADPDWAARVYLHRVLGVLQVGAIPDFWQRNPEMLDVYSSIKLALKVNSLGNRPFIVLASSNITFPSKDKYYTIAVEMEKEARIKLSQLSSQGKVEIVPDTDLKSIVWNNAVEKAIQEVYSKVSGK